MPFDAAKDLTPIIMVSANSLALIVNAGVPAANFREFLAYARANPGKLAYSPAGNGSINHLSGELLAMQTGTKLLHVPYGGGGPALTAVVAGEVGFIVQSAGGPGSVWSRHSSAPAAICHQDQARGAPQAGCLQATRDDAMGANCPGP